MKNYILGAIVALLILGALYVGIRYAQDYEHYVVRQNAAEILLK